MEVRVIRLPVFDILINLLPDGKEGAITSSLHEDGESAEYEAAMDAVESLILAHACAGVDIESPAYLEGIETTINAAANNI